MALILLATSVFTIGLLTLVIPGVVLALVWLWYWYIWRGHLAQP
jgi:O-antigen/teichoic acid export membrane protein